MASSAKPRGESRDFAWNDGDNRVVLKKRGRGRPKGSKNKISTAIAPTSRRYMIANTCDGVTVQVTHLPSLVCENEGKWSPYKCAVGSAKFHTVRHVES